VRETNGFWVFAFAIFAEFSAQRKPNLSGFPLNCAAKFGEQRSAESATKLCALCRPKIAIFAEEKKTPCFFFFEQFRVFTSTCCFFRKFATLPLGMTLRILETGRFADDYAIIPVLR
jgi:threonine/homoserine efflux transporter RhtA